MLNNLFRANVAFCAAVAKVKTNGNENIISFDDNDIVQVKYLSGGDGKYMYSLNDDYFTELEFHRINNGTKVQFHNLTAEQPELKVIEISNGGELIQFNNTKSNVSDISEGKLTLKGNAFSHITQLTKKGELIQEDQSESFIANVLGKAKILLNPEVNSSETIDNNKKSKCTIDWACDGSIKNNKGEKLPGEINLELNANSIMDIKSPITGKFRIFQKDKSVLTAKNIITQYDTEKVYGLRKDGIYTKEEKANITSKIDLWATSRFKCSNMDGKVDVDILAYGDNLLPNLMAEGRVGKDVKITQKAKSVSEINALLGQLQLLERSYSKIAKLEGKLDISKSHLKKDTDQNGSYIGQYEDNMSVAHIEEACSTANITVDGSARAEYKSGNPITENKNQKWFGGSTIKQVKNFSKVKT